MLASKSASSISEIGHGYYPSSSDVPFTRRAKKYGCLLASLQLLVSGNDLSSRKRPSSRTAKARAHQEPAPWPLGIRSRPILHLGPPESPDQEIRPGYPLC